MRSKFKFWLKRNNLKIVTGMWLFTAFGVTLLHIYVYSIGGLQALSSYFVS